MPQAPAIVRLDAAVPAADLAPPTMLAAGEWRLGEFRIAQSAVDPRLEWPMVPTLDDALGHIALTDAPPELLLLAQPRPGAVTQADVDRLLVAAPLARLIIVAGSWCEGELRTGRPPVGVVRLYWHEFPAWWRAATAQRARGRTPPWSAPLDEPRSGQRWRLDAPHDASSPVACRGRIAIDAGDFTAFEALAAALIGEGWECVWRPRCRRVARDAAEESHCIAGIFDGGQLDDAELAALAEFCQGVNGCAPPAVVALLDYPRAEHVAAACAAGAGAVLGKPYNVDLLAAELARLAATTRRPAPFA